MPGPLQNFSGAVTINQDLVIGGSLSTGKYNGIYYVATDVEFRAAVTSVAADGGGHIILTNTESSAIIDLTAAVAPVNCIIEGQGYTTILRRGFLGEMFNGNMYNLTFKNLTLSTKNGDDVAVNMFQLNNSSTVYFDNVNFIGQGLNAVINCTSVATLSLTNCRFFSGQNLINVPGTVSHMTISGCNFKDVSSVISSNANTTNYNITGCTFEDCTGDAIDLNGSNWLFTNNFLDGCVGGVRCQVTSGRGVIDGNHFINQVSGDTICVNASSGAKVIISNNYLIAGSGSPGKGIFVSEDNTVIIGNTIRDYPGNDIEVVASNCIITSNIFDSSTLSGKFHIVLGAGGNNNLVRSNSFMNLLTSDPTLKAMSITGGTNLHSTVKDNIGQFWYTTTTGSGEEIDPHFSYVAILTTGVHTVTVPDLELCMTGHICKIIFQTDGGDLTLSFTSITGRIGESVLQSSSILFADANDYIIVEWMGSNWRILDYLGIAPLEDLFVGDLTINSDVGTGIGLLIDSDSVEALLVRADGDTLDALVVDTTNSRVNVNAPSVTDGTLNVDGNIRLDVGTNNRFQIANSGGNAVDVIGFSNSGDTAPLNDGDHLVIGELSTNLDEVRFFTGANSGLTMTGTGDSTIAFFDESGSICFGSTTTLGNYVNVVLDNANAFLVTQGDGTSAVFNVDTTSAPKVTVGSSNLAENVNLNITSSSGGNPRIRIFADSNTSGNNDNPLLELKQKAGSVRGVAGLSGDTGVPITGIGANSAFIGTTTNDPLEFGTNGVKRMTLEAVGNLDLIGNLNVDGISNGITVGDATAGGDLDLLLLNGDRGMVFSHIDATDRIEFRNTDTTNGGEFVISGLGSIEMAHWYMDGTTAADSYTEIKNNLFSLAGGLQVGSATGGDLGAGNVNVATDIYKNDTAYTNPDYVFEQAYTGKMIRFGGKPGAGEFLNNGGLRSVDDLLCYTKEFLHFPGTDNPTTTGGMFGRSDKALEILEQLYLYTFDLKRRIDDLKKRKVT